jgi:hypothetical protein
MNIKVDWNGAAKPLFILMGTVLALVLLAVVYAVTK